MKKLKPGFPALVFSQKGCEKAHKEDMIGCFTYSNQSKHRSGKSYWSENKADISGQIVHNCTLENIDPLLIWTDQKYDISTQQNWTQISRYDKKQQK